ncbi:nucleoside diphosphate kinase regulator [Emcibacter sp. SYSU 3D8]|uniref:nucleoside diphosphate kinase regulator n=1 Tax=Emcibacter sp. SYSU 3D8 TaxID=3133969 RepID=UPI0031FF1957
MNPTLPPIIVTETDFDFLCNLTATRGGALSEVMSFLEQELERADVVPDPYLPADAVRLHSRVTYRDLVADLQRTVTLSYPHEEDISRGLVSILTPVGAALLGLRVGQRIAWRSWADTPRELEVLAVEPG